MQPSRRNFIATAAGMACVFARPALSGSGIPTASRSPAPDDKPAAPINPKLVPPGVEDVCDYARSFVTFIVKGRGNLARLQVESRCILFDRAAPRCAGQRSEGSLQLG